MKSLNTFIQEGSSKSCPQGQYYCFTDKKCKKIPSGYFVGRRGYLEQEKDSEESKKNGNGNGSSNGNGNGGNGNGNGGNGGGNGGGMSEELNKDDKPFVKKLVGKLRSGSKTHAKQADDLEKAMKEESNPRIPRKKGQPANSKKHSDLYTDENPKGTIHGLGFKDVATAKASVSKIRNSSRSHAHKIQAAVAMEQRAREMGKTSEAAVYRKYINSMKKKTKKMNEAANPAQQAAIAINMKKKGKKPKSMSENTFGLHYKTGKGFDVRVNNTSIRNTVDNVKTGVDAVKNIKSDGLVDGIQKTINDKKPPLKAKPSPSKVVDDAISNYKQLNMGEGSLHKWFKGSKSKDGKGGWVNVVTGGTCASDEPGEGTPKCVSSSKRASMTKAERLSAARRKKKADPGQQSKTGAAKPTYVSTDKPKKKMKEEIELTEVKDKKGKGSGTKDACYHKVKSRYSVWPSAYASGALVKCRKVGAANWGNKSEEVEVVNEVSKKTLGSYVKKAATEIGTSAMKGDYKKMQKRHKGVLDASDKLQKEGAYMGPDKKDLKQIKKMDNPDYAKKLADYEKNMDPKKRQALKDKATKGMKFTHEETTNEAKKCWPGYKKTGTQKLFGKTYNRCVKKEDLEHVREASAAWTRKAGKAKSGGLNEKGRKSYERENPGSDLKAPSKKVGNPRRASFCARMKGMKKRLTSAKTARDPDSRINKSLRAWNC